MATNTIPRPPRQKHTQFFFLFSKAQGANFNQSINCNRLSYHREKTAILIQKKVRKTKGNQSEKRL